MKQKFKFFLLKLASYFPTRIPIGVTTFEAWVQDIIDLSGLPATNESLKWVICQKVTALPDGQPRISKHYMVKSIQKAASNEVASYLFYTIKKQQEEARKAAQQKAADTAPAQVPEDVQKT